jgi:hypothetical protein
MCLALVRPKAAREPPCDPRLRRSRQSPSSRARRRVVSSRGKKHSIRLWRTSIGVPGSDRREIREPLAFALEANGDDRQEALREVGAPPSVGDARVGQDLGDERAEVVVEDVADCFAVNALNERLGELLPVEDPTSQAFGVEDHTKHVGGLRRRLAPQQEREEALRRIVPANEVPPAIEDDPQIRTMLARMASSACLTTESALHPYGILIGSEAGGGEEAVCSRRAMSSTRRTMSRLGWSGPIRW